MNIYYPILCYFPSQAGGPANTVFWMNEELAEVGHSCLVTSTLFGLAKNAVINQKIYSSANKVNFVRNSLGFFRISELKKVLLADVIHFSSLFFKPTLPLLIVGFLLRKSIVLSPRGELYPEALEKSRRIKLTYLFLLRLLSGRIKFHATNEFEKYLIESHFPRNLGIGIIPNYIPIENLQSVRQQYQILFLGRINEIKNIHLLVEALDILKKSMPSCPKLIIAGKAEIESEKRYLDDLKREIMVRRLENEIVFRGQVEGDQKLILLQESLCTVLPSKSENFGNVVIESLMMGTPVIASTGTPWESLENRGVGFWIDPSPIEISKAILKIINLNKDAYQKMRVESRKYIEEEFDIRSNVNKWLKFYQ